MSDTDTKCREGIYREFNDDIVPVVQFLGKEFPKDAPIEAYNEVRAILTHFLRIQKDSGASEEGASNFDVIKEYDKAYRHIERCYLDVRKYACILIRDRVSKFLNPRHNWRIHRLDEGRFLTRITAKRLEATQTLLSAKKADAEPGKEDAKRLYNEAYEKHKDLYEYLSQFSGSAFKLRIAAIIEALKSWWGFLVALVGLAVTILGFIGFHHGS